MLIGIFDGSLGGLAVAAGIRRRLPAHDILFVADTARSPYGPRSDELIADGARRMAGWLLDRGAQALVAAGHAVSAAVLAGALDDLSQSPSGPVMEAISPAVDAARRATRNRRVGVIAAAATVRSAVYPRGFARAAPDTRVHVRCCPLLDGLAAEGRLDRPETRLVVRKYLHALKTRQVDTLLPAGGQWQPLVPVIRSKAGRRITVVSAAEALAGLVAARLHDAPAADRPASRPGLEVRVTDAGDSIYRQARLHLGGSCRPAVARI